MTRLDFRVKEHIGGLDWWKRDGYPTKQDVTLPTATAAANDSIPEMKTAEKPIIEMIFRSMFSLLR